MKRSKLNSLFTDKELQVADILLDLRHLVFRPPQSPTVICNWGVKRRRTAIDQDDDDSVKVIKPPELNSPSTPLSFALAESENPHKSRHSRRKFSHRTKPELLELLGELNQCNEQLTKEVNVVRAYHQKILTENSNLKAQRKEAYSEKRKTQVENSNNRGLRIDGSQKQATEHLNLIDPVVSCSQVLGENASGPFRCPDLNLTPSGLIDSGFDFGPM